MSKYPDSLDAEGHASQGTTLKGFRQERFVDGKGKSAEQETADKFGFKGDTEKSRRKLVGFHV